MNVVLEFPCVDCDGTAHLLTIPPPDTPLVAGTVLSYRCGSCWERFDVVWEDLSDDG